MVSGGKAVARTVSIGNQDFGEMIKQAFLLYWTNTSSNALIGSLIKDGDDDVHLYPEFYMRVCITRKRNTY